MSMNRRQILSFACASAVLPLFPGRACAAGYPARPVRMLVGFPAGGTADILTRMVCDRLQDRLGQAFVVENRPGAATNLATEAVVRAPADGYTLLATTTSNLLNGALYEDMKYDFIRDIAPVAGIAMQPLVLVAAPTLAAKSVAELVAYGKANPGSLSIGNFGTGTISHLAAEAFKQATGIEFLSIAYRGSTQMLTDLLGGRIQAAFDNIPASMEHIRSGALRALAVTSVTRSKALPDVPAMADFVTGYEAITIAGVGAPRGTPGDIIDKLNAEINAGLAEAKLGNRLDDLGSTVLGGSAAEFAKLIARETERWSGVIRTSGIKLN
jgi:tripartite-type tricarboxylate transporter receptor subunit TctC